jgi:hypothetical protein
MNDELLNTILEDELLKTILEDVFATQVPEFIETISSNQNVVNFANQIRDLSFNLDLSNIILPLTSQYNFSNSTSNNDFSNNDFSNNDFSNNDFPNNDFSNNDLFSRIRPNQLDETRITDVSNNISFEQMLQVRQTNTAEKCIELIEDFTLRWFRHIHEYDESIRLYHQNISQMNRITQHLSRNIHQITDQTTFNSQRPLRRSVVPPSSNRFNPFEGLEVRGFSFPIQQTSNVDNIYPNIRQIMNATETFVYNTDTTESVQDSTCPISLETFVLGEELCRIHHCQHVFKWRHIQEWFSTSAHCPVCRYDIRLYTRV